MKSASIKKIEPRGVTGALLRSITDNWLIGMRENNPAIIDMFADREKEPYRDLLPWSGEFAGKYITGAWYVYRLTRDRKLLEYVAAFMDKLISTQAEDGYLGCFRRECRLTGAYSQNPSVTGVTWDAWSHYHIMYGLLLWYGETRDARYLCAAESAAGLFLRKFYGSNPPLSSIGSTEMNLGVLHVFVLLYNVTGRGEYLDFALAAERDLSSPGCGDYVELALRGIDFYRGPKPRWESLHIVAGVLELYRATGADKYLHAARQIYGSILKTDVHNTGAFSTGEGAVGSPFAKGPIETCCVVAFDALASELYKETGDAKIIDFLERAHYNACLGAWNPGGRWSTYDTPMDGEKCANFHTIGFQCRPGSPELNCCSVNAPRGAAQLADWLICEDGDALVINGYEPVAFITEDNTEVVIEGCYPAAGTVEVRLNSHGNIKTLMLRIPSWSRSTRLAVGGSPVNARSGDYMAVRKVWDGDTVTLDFDFSVYFEPGGQELAGKYSVYSGPLLFGADSRDNPGFYMSDAAQLRRADFDGAVPRASRDGSIILELSSGALLRDFRSLGQSGSRYRTWLAVKDIK